MSWKEWYTNPKALCLSLRLSKLMHMYMSPMHGSAGEYLACVRNFFVLGMSFFVMLGKYESMFKVIF